MLNLDNQKFLLFGGNHLNTCEIFEDAEWRKCEDVNFGDLVDLFQTGIRGFATATQTPVI